ncbi:MAG: hypothetical protein ACLQGP_39145 [Isosphaeraceae bacterium]
MNLIRKSAWMAVMLGAVIGCAGEEEGGAKPSTPTTPPGEKPISKPESKSAPAKATPSKEMTPPPATKPEEPKKVGDLPTLEGPKQTSNAQASPVTLKAEELAAIKALPAAEQDLAIKQAVCPVSSHHLGSMEKPVKVTAEGRTFYLCCEGCEEELKADPKAIIAKLDKK